MSALTYATAQLLRVMPRAQMGRALGRLAELPWPTPVGRAVVALYTRAYRVELGECEEVDGYASFDAFFTRSLRGGVRPVDADPRAVVSVADGALGSTGVITPDSTWLVKGRPYSVAELLGDAEEARQYEGGLGCVIYLSPRDYHRVHAPVAGVISRVRSLPGDYFPVNSIGMRHVPNLFIRNRRVAISIDASEPGLGRVAVVMVSAMIVGRITVTGVASRDVPLGDHFLDIPVSKGGELGMFHLGSTAVVLLPRCAAGRWVASEGPVRFGERIALCAPSRGARASRAEERGAG